MRAAYALWRYGHVRGCLEPCDWCGEPSPACCTACAHEAVERGSVALTGVCTLCLDWFHGCRRCTARSLWGRGQGTPGGPGEYSGGCCAPIDVDEVDLDSSEAESLEGMATIPIGASEAPAAAARRHWLPDPGFPRVTNLDEQARLFASDEETIIITQLIALAKEEPVGLPHPPTPAPAAAARARADPPFRPACPRRAH